MIDLAAAFGASMAFIALKALQQRNVAFDNFAWVMPTSFLMSAAEVWVVANVAAKGWEWALVAAIGAGSGTGAIAAMLFHKRFIHHERNRR